MTHRSRKTAHGLARLAAFMTVSSLLVALVTTRRARADVAEAALALGRDVAPLVEQTEEGRSLVVNGQRLLVSSTVVQGDAVAVLDHYEARCKSGSRALES